MPGRFWDACATALSSTCILHCLALPLFATMLPVTFQLVDNHVVHLVLVLLAAPVTLWVVLSEGLTGSGQLFTPVALSGLALMLAAVTFWEAFEMALTIIGGTMLGGAHVWRWLRHQKVVERPATDKG